ncbi:MAG: peptide deformylase, partial [Bacillota bacterium]
MAIRKIIKIGDEKLRKISKTVTNFNARLETLLDDMVDTMRDSNGAGLAAPQVGVLKRCCVVEVEDRLFRLVNPEIIAAEGEQAGTEGCLSIPERLGF